MTADLTVAALQEALDAGWMTARYQPVVRIADRVPVSLEVLARLDHPTLGTLTPDRFISAMEAAGLGWRLTQAIVGRAFSEWSGARLTTLGMTLALNFPLDVLEKPDAGPWLLGACTASGIVAEQVTIELTESQPLSKLDPLRSAVAWLRHAGFGLAIDDVGPDVRDHRLLLDSSFTTLKLDKDLVRRSATDAAAHAFLLTSIAAARTAHLTLVAEGIEDAALWSRMADLGIEQAQGYLIGKPMRVQDVAGWLERWRAAPAV